MTPLAAKTDPIPFTSALIIDDHPLFCEALVMTLQSVAGLQQVFTAPCLQDALPMLQHQPDLILLDLNLPDVQGLEGLTQLKRLSKAPVLVISSMADNRVISAALHAGAAGFIPKHSQREVFQAAVEGLRRGERFVPPGYLLLPVGKEESGGDAAARVRSLTQQQTRILRLICEGKLNKQIAFDLTIAETTVKAHVTAILRKLGVHSRTQAVLRAGDAGFHQALPNSGGGA
ncbi:MAG: response regulator transcription factor [Rhodobacteraceae bacterium]|nr:response regulator transcription factor [Paracoccaceae bacterium]